MIELYFLFFLKFHSFWMTFQQLYLIYAEKIKSYSVGVYQKKPIIEFSHKVRSNQFINFQFARTSLLKKTQSNLGTTEQLQKYQQ